MKNDIIKAKLRYKGRIEQDFTNINTKQAFQKIKALIGQLVKQDHSTIIEPPTYVNTLNICYSTFDITDFSAACDELLKAHPSEPPSSPPFGEHDVSGGEAEQV